jgi:hypothetical protein
MGDAMENGGFRSRPAGDRRPSALLWWAIAAGVFLPHQPVAAQERWAQEKEQAIAALPSPQGTSAVAGGSMICAEQRWSFQLDLGGEAKATGGAMTLFVDGNEFATESEAAPGRIEITVPFEALEPLKRGLRLTFSFGEEDAAALGAPDFSLIGSRAAMTAMEDVCSRPDMSAYRPITFTPFSSYLGLAKQLRETDIDQFRLATSSEPELTAAMAEFGDGRRVLFTRLCGSSWYFGRSGCNVTGFAPDSGDREWRIAYDTEGVLIYIDHENDEFGWPDLITLPARAGGIASTWRWQGASYRLLAE